jgi:hypothetical protein
LTQSFIAFAFARTEGFMNGHGHPSMLFSVLIVALIAWRLYSRFRRSVGRQRLSKVRPWITVSVFPILTALFIAYSIGNTWAMVALLGGIAVGIGLGVYGLRLTRFDVTEAGLYYTPSAHLGIALSLVLVARIGYRAMQGGLLLPGPGAGAAPPPPTSTPFTLLIFGALAGYYVTYAIGLLRWGQSVAANPAAVKPEQPAA